MTARILVIGPRDSGFSGPDHRPYVVDLIQSEPRLTSLQTDRADRVEIVDLDDTDAVLKAARWMHQDSPFDGVIAFHEHLLEKALAVAEDLNIAGTRRQAIHAAADKAHTRAIAAASGWVQPPYEAVPSAEDVPAALDRVGRPAVIKPLNGAGSANVRLITGSAPSPTELAAVHTGSWIIERFLDGPEFSVETITTPTGTTVRAITEKVMDPDTFVEVGHNMPARISDEIRQRIVSFVKDLMAALDPGWAPGHTELRIIDGKPVLIETHVRYGGDRIWQLTGLTTGYYPQADALNVLAGYSPTPLTIEYPAASIRFLTAPPGIVSSVEDTTAISHLSGVLDVNVNVQVGDRAHSLSSSDSRLGYIVTGGTTVNSAAENSELAQSKLSIVTYTE
ncbi:ATP-grasp domain-containing protein [Actinopolyspora sp. H202]|uniref:ATP-grasp domain-containing protein n=1 Tax=Actinopolyspora sp. H202 TaxID=1500456 RepID=UPI003EE5CDF7